MKQLLRLLLCSFFFLLACEPSPAPECKTDKECSNNKICQQGKCTAKTCKTDKECDSQERCNTTTKTCEKTPSCPEKETGGCCEDSHCPKGKICTKNKCTAKPCQTDEECKKKDPNKPRCLDKKCVEADRCKKNEDCKDPTKPECNTGKCVALPKAKLGEECSNRECEDKTLCYAEVGKPFCRELCKPFDPICTGGSVCTFIGNGKGVCLSRNNGKTEGESCVSRSCERHLFCVDWTDKICAKICRPDKQDCANNELCQDFGNIHLCVPKPPICGTGRPCQNQWLCDTKKNLCFPKQCPNEPCQSGEICKIGRCVARNCCKGDPCRKGNVCNRQTGKCASPELKVPFCTSCLGNGKCAQPSQQCLTLSSKTDRLCADECTASKTCTDPLMVCQKQNSGKWFCLPKAGTCQRNRCDNVTCKDNETCLPSKQKCVQIGLTLCQPCEDDLQCGGTTDKCIIKKGEKQGYCARDCGGCMTQCPNGYSCQSYQGSQQCLPTSGTCK